MTWVGSTAGGGYRAGPEVTGKTERTRAGLESACNQSLRQGSSPGRGTDSEAALELPRISLKLPPPPHPPHPHCQKSSRGRAGQRAGSLGSRLSRHGGRPGLWEVILNLSAFLTPGLTPARPHSIASHPLPLTSGLPAGHAALPGLRELSDESYVAGC